MPIRNAGNRSVGRGRDGVFRCAAVDIFIGDDGAADWFVPATGVIEQSIGANGGDKARGGDGDLIAAFENVFEGAAKIEAALLVEAGGAGVAENDAAVGDLEVVGNPLDAAPLKESSFDGAAVRMIADGAFAGVARGVRRGLRDSSAGSSPGAKTRFAGARDLLRLQSRSWLSG